MKWGGGISPYWIWKNVRTSEKMLATPLIALQVLGIPQKLFTSERCLKGMVKLVMDWTQDDLTSGGFMVEQKNMAADKLI